MGMTSHELGAAPPVATAPPEELPPLPGTAPPELAPPLPMMDPPEDQLPPETAPPEATPAPPEATPEFPPVAAFSPASLPEQARLVAATIVERPT